MRHAAARAPRRQPASRAAQITLGVIAYTIAGMSTCLITAGAVITFWALWQWLGVN